MAREASGVRRLAAALGNVVSPMLVPLYAGTGKGFVMKASRYVFLFALSFIPTTLAAQVNDTYVIPATSNASGLFGTRWMTQFSVFNPQTYDLRVSVTFLPSGGGHPLEALITVPSNSVAFADNALQEICNIGGPGAVLGGPFPQGNPGGPHHRIPRPLLVVDQTPNKPSH